MWTMEPLRDRWRNLEELATFNPMENEPERTLADEWRTEGPEVAFGQRVRELRLARGWSQEDLAERLTALGFQFHQTQIGKLENGGRPIRLNEAGALAAIFEVPLPDLIATPVLGTSDPIYDQIAELGIRVSVLAHKKKALQEERLKLENQLMKTAMDITSHENVERQMQSELRALYTQQTSSYKVYLEKYKRGYFEVRRTGKGAFYFRLTIDDRLLLVSTMQWYERVNNALLDIDMLRYLAPKLVPYSKGSQPPAAFRMTEHDDGLYSLGILIKGQHFASGSHASESEVWQDLEKIKELAPHMPVRVYQWESAKVGDDSVALLAAPTPKTAVTYRLMRDKDWRYSFRGLYPGGNGKLNISSLGSGYDTRTDALIAIKRLVEMYPGNVQEVTDGGNVDIDLNRELGLHSKPSSFPQLPNLSYPSPLSYDATLPYLSEPPPQSLGKLPSIDDYPLPDFYPSRELKDDDDNKG